MLAIKKSAEFQKIFNSGRWVSSQYVMIYFMPNGQDNNKIGVAVGKKVGKSVKRNRVKRVIREAYRKIENRVQVGNNIVIIAKNNIDLTLVNLSNILNDLEKCFEKAKLLIV